MKAQNNSDYELVTRFINGEGEAIDELIHRYKNKVYTYIYLTVKNQPLAEDIFQDTFIKVMRSLKDGKYSDNGRFLSWIMRIAHNLIIDHYRKEKQLNTCSSTVNDIDLFNSPKFSDDNIEQIMINEQVLKDVRRLVDELPPDQKEIILLRHYGGLSFKEIAEQTDVSINTALGRMRYAIINLRRLIEQYQINLTLS